MTVIKDELWPVARLIPISSASGIEAQERRTASALLAVIDAVPLIAITGMGAALIQFPMFCFQRAKALDPARGKPNAPTLLVSSMTSGRGADLWSWA
jgi:hypothetical protein